MTLFQLLRQTAELDQESSGELAMRFDSKSIVRTTFETE
jgi:hypothetical protein